MSIDKDRRALLTLLAGTLAACQGDDETPPANTATVGAAGGTVDGPAGSRVVVPAGALAGETAIAIAASSNGAPALPAGFVPMGAVHALTPHGTVFAQPATLVLPFDTAAFPAGTVPALFKTNAQGAWERVAGATVQGAQVTAQIGSFSWTTLGDLPPVISTQPADASVLAPATASFSVAASGYTGLQWQRSDDGGAHWVDIAGATLAGYTTAATRAAPAASGGDDGALFRVLLRSPAGNSLSAAARLTVTAPAAAVGGLRIAAGSGFSIAAPVGGTVASWGLAGSWLGGNGNNLVDQTVPGPVLQASQVVAVAAGSAHALALAANGEVWSWGYNGFGQLCNDTFNPNPHDLPFKANGVTGMVAVAAGANHSVFLRADGTVWTVGRNHQGQLGHGDTADHQAMRQVSGLTGVTAIAAGGNHTLALKGDGTVWAWGANDSGQLGDGSTTNRPLPAAVAGVTDAIRIAAGWGFSLALVREFPANPFGVLWGWGQNDRGQLANGNAGAPLLQAALRRRAPLVEISAGGANCVLLYFDGTVFTAGDHQRGQLGDPTFTADHSAEPRHVQTLPSGARAVCAGGGWGHTLVFMQDGSVWAWGDNENGQLGRGSKGGSSSTPRAVTGLNLN